ncbi:hypothetical protein L6R52_11345, partial [Myxococcota bacterium]|nr:hypothetical protein [Myxococcota bacterium]
MGDLNGTGLRFRTGTNFLNELNRDTKANETLTPTAANVTGAGLVTQDKLDRVDADGRGRGGGAHLSEGEKEFYDRML